MYSSINFTDLFFPCKFPEFIMFPDSKFSDLKNNFLIGVNQEGFPEVLNKGRISVDRAPLKKDIRMWEG